MPLCPRSFDEFIQNKMQDVVDEQLPIEILPEPQVPEDHPDFIRKKFRFKFGQIYLSTPQLTEKDGTTDTMRPMVARIRNLTYCAPLFVDISKTVTEVDENGADIRLLEKEDERMFIGKIPIMLQSTYCVLKGQANKGLTDMGEVRTTKSLPALCWATPVAPPVVPLVQRRAHEQQNCVELRSSVVVSAAACVHLSLLCPFRPSVHVRSGRLFRDQRFRESSRCPGANGS